VLLGALATGLAQAAAPVGVPLYDGVVPQEPYRYLDPAAGQAGDPTAYMADVPVSDGSSPHITAATSENPPQAQLIALEGTFELAAGTTSIAVEISAVPTPAAQPPGPILGNVYEVSVTDAADGAALGVGSDLRPTLALRAPSHVPGAAIMRFDGTAWQQLDTVRDSTLAIFTAEPNALGQFAVVDLGGGTDVATWLVPLILAAVVAAAIALFAVRSYRRRRPPAPPAGAVRTASSRRSRRSRRR
jgi:hypothetical protein